MKSSGCKDLSAFDTNQRGSCGTSWRLAGCNKQWKVYILPDHSSLLLREQETFPDELRSYIDISNSRHSCNKLDARIPCELWLQELGRTEWPAGIPRGCSQCRMCSEAYVHQALCPGRKKGATRHVQMVPSLNDCSGSGKVKEPLSLSR